MSGGLAWLDQLSWPMLLLIGGWLMVAPYPMAPEPHLVEKLRMLFEGALTKPLDIFDLLLHATPLVLIAIKAWRQFDGVTL